MWVHLYLKLIKFVLDVCHALLRPRKLKYKISKSNDKSTFNVSVLVLCTYNIHYGPNLSWKFYLNWMVNAEAIQLTMLRAKGKRRRDASALCAYHMNNLRSGSILTKFLAIKTICCERFALKKFFFKFSAQKRKLVWSPPNNLLIIYGEGRLRAAVRG